MLRLTRFLPLLVLAVPADADELPVRAVTLSNAGLVQVERSGPLAPAAAVTLRVPTEDVDDVLKSLLVRDPAGVVEGVRLPARDLAAEAFRGLPLRPEDFAGRTALLSALRGQAVEAGGVAGRLADAEDVEVREGGATATATRLTLVTESGLRTITLREGDDVRLTDPDLAARVRRAAEALAANRAADSRVVELRLRGAAAAREVTVATVTAAPVWKPSWRLLVPPGDGPARLQGWAVVENRSGADWDGVRLALVSGNPAAFHQPLYTPITVSRPELPVRVAEGVTVRPDTGALPPPPAPPPMVAMAAPTMAPAAPTRGRAVVGGLVQEAEPRFADTVAALPPALSASAAGRVAFTLPTPVTVRAGRLRTSPSSTPRCRRSGYGGCRTSRPATRSRPCGSGTPAARPCRTASPPSSGPRARKPAATSATRRSARSPRTRPASSPSRATATCASPPRRRRPSARSGSNCGGASWPSAPSGRRKRRSPSILAAPPGAAAVPG
ncbi:DUF4139 domain-containing protein [Roseomonas sp. CCTCC AB2023176]|uniref:DUF4139 domain-containing protein n=1 Tax=Roseomonas sp. CCTCC AB2023176 TaxID=3342640 RepID=UPI0035D54117